MLFLFFSQKMHIDAELATDYNVYWARWNALNCSILHFRGKRLSRRQRRLRSDMKSCIFNPDHGCSTQLQLIPGDRTKRFNFNDFDEEKRCRKIRSWSSPSTLFFAPLIEEIKQRCSFFLRFQVALFQRTYFSELHNIKLGLVIYFSLLPYSNAHESDLIEERWKETKPLLMN